MITSKESLRGVAPYVPGRPISEIKRELGLSQVTKLASNENPLGASPRVREAVRNAADSVFLYPDPGAYSLRMALSEKLNLSPDCFIFGTGSDGLIELVTKTFLTRGDESVLPDPSFSLYELNVLAQEATPVKVPLSPDFAVAPLAMLPYINEKTKVVWLCNPNNPTGNSYTEAEQLAFLEAVPDSVLVVIDEAYYEYGQDAPDFPDSLSLLQARKNILILRTFSKIYGLAGLRVGYGMAHPHIIRELEKTRPPFNVCTPAQLAAEAALEDQDFVQRSLKENKANKEILQDGFQQMGLSFIESHTNFVAVNIKKDAKAAADRLLHCGYIVKGGHVLGLPGYLRVSIGTKEECRGFLAALASVLEEI